MSNASRILVVDDNPENRAIFTARLEAHGYEVLTAEDGEAALEVARQRRPDLILLDIMMPKIDGIEVCRQLKQDPNFPFTPIVLVTAKSDPKDVVAGLEAGAEEYLTKPVDQTALIARVRSMLRVKLPHDEKEQQARELAELNEHLEQRVSEQVGELERLGQLKRFFSPQIAELIITSGDQVELKSHRREISVISCDLRGFTAFSGAAEPEEEMQLLREYHQAIGALIFSHGATLEHIAGDGAMAFFNDPVPCTEPALRAVRLALAMRDEVSGFLDRWSKRGFKLGFGAGAALGFATMGHIGVEGQFHYAVVGSVANLAARLCDQAKDGEVLVEPRLLSNLAERVEVVRVGDLALKGFAEPVATCNVLRLVEGVRLSE